MSTPLMEEFTVFRNFVIMFAALATTLTNALNALNHVAKSALERSVVLEQKSVQAAALSKLESDFVLAERLKAIHGNKGINKGDLEAGRKFIAEYLRDRV
jgi:hypothetical protein